MRQKYFHGDSYRKVRNIPMCYLIVFLPVVEITFRKEPLYRPGTCKKDKKNLKVPFILHMCGQIHLWVNTWGYLLQITYYNTHSGKTFRDVGKKIEGRCTSSVLCLLDFICWKNSIFTFYKSEIVKLWFILQLYELMKIVFLMRYIKKHLL